MLPWDPCQNVSKSVIASTRNYLDKCASSIPKLSRFMYLKILIYVQNNSICVQFFFKSPPLETWKKKKITASKNVQNLEVIFFTSNSNCVQIGQMLNDNRGFWALWAQRWCPFRLKVQSKLVTPPDSIKNNSEKWNPLKEKAQIWKSRQTSHK